MGKAPDTRCSPAVDNVTVFPSFGCPFSPFVVALVRPHNRYVRAARARVRTPLHRDGYRDTAGLDALPTLNSANSVCLSVLFYSAILYSTVLTLLKEPTHLGGRQCVFVLRS